MVDNVHEEVEDKIIDYINSGVEGRLIIFKPEKSSFGEDLVAERRANYSGKMVLFKIIPILKNETKKTIKESNFRASDNFYFIFVRFNLINRKIDEKVWLVPSKNSIKGSSFEFDTEKKENSKFLMDKKRFSALLIKNLIEENKPKPKQGFKIGHI